MKRYAIAFNILMVLAMLLSACGTPTPEVIRETVEVVKTVEVTKEVVVTKEVEVEKPVDRRVVIYNSYASDPAPRAADEALVKMFEEAHPDIEVQHSTVAHEDFKQAIRAYLTASTPPDVMTWFAGNRARFFIDKGLVADISDVFAEKGFNESYAPGFVALATVNDKQYFLPTSYYWWAVYYVPSVFEKAGITQVPQTWDEFLGACDTLNAAGITPITIGTRYPWTAAAWFVLRRGTPWNGHSCVARKVVAATASSGQASGSNISVTEPASHAPADARTTAGNCV